MNALPKGFRIAALVLIAGGLLGATRADAGYKEVRRLSKTWHFETGRRSIVLDLHTDRTFRLKVRGYGRTTGIFSATDDELSLRTGEDRRHFHYALRGGELLIRPSHKDRRSRRATSLLDMLPPHHRYRIVALHAHAHRPVRPTVVTGCAPIRPFITRPVVVHQPPCARPVVVRPGVVHRPVVTRPVIVRPGVVHRPPISRPIVVHPGVVHRPPMTRPIVGCPPPATRPVIVRPGTCHRPPVTSPIVVRPGVRPVRPEPVVTRPPTRPGSHNVITRPGHNHRPEFTRPGGHRPGSVRPGNRPIGHHAHDGRWVSVRRPVR